MDAHKMYPFARILPNEHLVSFVGRLYVLGMHSSFKYTLADFQLTNNLLRPGRFFSTADSVLARLARFDSVQDSWCSHGNGNYAMPFLTEPERSNVRDFLETGGALVNIRGEYSMAVDYWRWCSHCVQDDISEYGMSFYHRDHNLPGVFRCPAHRVGLCGSCGNCGFSAQVVPMLPTPPQGNRCPACGYAFEPYDDYFCDEMSTIEKWTLWLSHYPRQLRFEDITRALRSTIGLPNDRVSTITDKRMVSAWFKDLVEGFDQSAVRCYFKPLLTQGTHSPNKLLKENRLYSPAVGRGPLHPLAHLIALCHHKIDLQELELNQQDSHAA